ncbi:MAG TPA: outer membrane beta-barrel protein [Gemmatimonadaceae bacterium]|nr:outer membrane beta-barrel protein [Gemmatimonadaceae bacterium]
MVSLTKFAAVAAIVISSATVAGAQSVTSATKPFSLGLSGGASIPTGDLSNSVNTGYNIGGHVGLGSPAIPIGFRGDVNYDNFGAKGSGNANAHVWSYTANAVYDVPTMTGIRPYIIGGIGGFKPGVSTSSGGSTYSASSGTKFGFDLGGGLTIPLSGFNAFVEARYNHFNNDGGGSTSFVPITFGVMF